jgi:hypothetical protein
MTRDHGWFTARAETLWASSPGRSMTCLVPAGSAEASGFPAFLETWLSERFRPPPPVEGFETLVVRVVPDQSTSAARIVSRIRQKATDATGADISPNGAVDPSEALEAVVRGLAAQKTYLVLVIDRFQSFARLADTATVTLLSQLRSLEHESSITTILISSQTCSTIRSRLPGGLAFVNSAYGDNHDVAVMPVLSISEFAASAPHLQGDQTASVHALGAGPDPVFQALIDESRQGLDGLDERGWIRGREALQEFAVDLFGQIGGPELDLLAAALAGSLNASQIAHLRSLPLAGFLFDLDGDPALSFRGRLAGMLAATLAQLPVARPAVRMRLLVCTANPDFDLDLEREVRAIQKVFSTAAPSNGVEIDTLGAVTPDDFLIALRRFQPTIVHFCGHGSKDGVLMRGEGGAVHVVTGAALAQTLQGRGVDLVVLNACYSDDQATALASKVGTVIGTRSELDDEAAIRFSGVLYRVLLEGGTLGEALRDGRDGLALYSLDDVYACHGNLERRYR